MFNSGEIFRFKHLLWVITIIIVIPFETNARHKCPKVPSPPGMLGLTTSPLSLPSGTFMAAARSLNTSGCDRGHPSSNFYRPSKAEVEYFIEQNHQMVLEESVRGKGPHLEALAGMSGCSDATVLFSAALQKHHETLFLEPPVGGVSNQEHPSARIITERIFNLKEDTQELNDRCSSS